MEIDRMVKPELGVKRVCGSCGAKFYDLNRDPILCPKCGTVFDVQAALKPRRAKAVVEDKPAKPKKVAAVVDPDEADLPDDIVDDDDTDDEEEEGVIEDTSELGEDDDDVAEVIEKVDDEGDR
ncbi:MAG: TIGR02300 family protein [Alphaproteobacteria bacterium]